MDIGPLGIERVRGQRIGVLAAHQSGQLETRRRRICTQTLGIAGRMHQPFAQCWHQFSVPANQKSVGIDEEERVVERSKPAWLELTAAHHHEYAGFLDPFTEKVEFGAGDGETILEQGAWKKPGLPGCSQDENGTRADGSG